MNSSDRTPRRHSKISIGLRKLKNCVKRDRRTREAKKVKISKIKKITCCNTSR